MASTEAQKKAMKKYKEKNTYRTIVMPNELFQEISEHAKRNEVSFHAQILEALKSWAECNQFN